MTSVVARLLPARLLPARLLAACSILLASVSLLAAQPPYKIGSLVIETPWLRQPPDGARVAGGFMRITNTGKEADRLISGSSPLAKRFELHEMAHEGGVMKMRELPKGVEILPGQTVELKPGGLHVMYLDLGVQPKAGDVAKTTLVFEKAGTITIDVVVLPRGQPGVAKRPHH